MNICSPIECLQGNKALVELLLQWGANPTLLDDQGKPPEGATPEIVAALKTKPVPPGYFSFLAGS